MRRSLWLVGVLLMVAWVDVAVSSQAAGPKFEAASVKLNHSRRGVRGHSFPGDRFEARNVPLIDLILVAYGEPGQLLPESRLVGSPGWINSDRYDISAKIERDSSNSVAQKQLMLRTLLMEHFSLVVHSEMRDLPMYALVVSKADGGSPRLRRADMDCDALSASQPGQRERCILYALPSGELTLRGQTMKALANTLTILLERPVADRTGLSGGFDADVQFNPEGLPGMSSPAPATHDAPSLRTALDEQLGLKLESIRGAVEVLVIDGVERPTEQ